MRDRLIFLLVVLVLGMSAYAYHRNPSGCEKLMSDIGAVPSGGLNQLKTDIGPFLASLSPFSPAISADAPIATLIDGHLVSADGKPYTFPADAPASSIQYYAIYYSAGWCAPCRTFTPVLAKWYKAFKPAHPNFELIFVSHDPDKGSMLAEMSDTSMPWPAFAYNDLTHQSVGIEKYSNNCLPDLVLVDANGKVLSDSFDGGTYVGPQRVVDDIQKLLAPIAQAPPAPVATASSAPAPPNPAPPPVVKLWSPPDMMPAQPNWTWTTLDGTTYNNVVVTQIEPKTVSITHSLGVAHIPIANLPRDIQKQLNYDPTAASQIPSLLLNNLVSSDGSDFSAPLESIQYYIFYYSARWCHPCHLFTPELVQWYNQFHATHPNFQMVFISEDSSESEMYAYMKEMAMPWPAMRYSKLEHSRDFKGPGVEQYAGNVIPFLTAVDVSGKIIAQTLYKGGLVYQDPVLNGLQSFPGGVLPSASPTASTPSLTTPTNSTPNPVPPPASAPDIVVSSFKPWTPPAVLPAQANWSWTTSYGTTYNDVVITQVGPETVSITHSMGVTHDIPIANLSPSIQRQLNYDPVAATAARRERDRENDHPYYTYAARAEAQDVARRMNWPVAWMITSLSGLSEANPTPDGEDDLAQRAVAHLKTRTVVVVSNNNDDLGSFPAILRNQFFVLDDGPMPGGHHFYGPKIVFTDADLTKVYGRIPSTQMKTQGDASFDGAIGFPPGGSATTPTNLPHLPH